jgi:hypothetical protein
MQVFTLLMEQGVHFTPVHLIIILTAFFTWLIASALNDFDPKKTWFWCLKCNEVSALLCIIEGIRASQASIAVTAAGKGFTLFGQLTMAVIFFFGGWMVVLGIALFFIGVGILLFLGIREALKKRLVSKIVSIVLTPFRAWLALNNTMAGVIADWKLKGFLKEPITSYRAYKMMLEDYGRWGRRRDESIEEYKERSES